MNNEFNFVRFTKVGSKLSNYSISFNKAKFFGLNSGFYSKEGIKNYKKVVLFYDASKKAVAFMFTNDEKAEGAFTITHGKNSGYVAPRSFLTEYQLSQEKYYGKKVPEKIKDPRLGTLFVIKI